MSLSARTFPPKSQFQAFFSCKSILLFDYYLISLPLVSIEPHISCINDLLHNFTFSLSNWESSWWSMIIISLSHTSSTTWPLLVFVILTWQRSNWGKSNYLSILCLYPSDLIWLEKKIQPCWLLLSEVIATKFRRALSTDGDLYILLSVSPPLLWNFFILVLFSFHKHPKTLLLSSLPTVT